MKKVKTGHTNALAVTVDDFTVGPLSAGDLGNVETIVHIYNIYVCFDAVILSSSFSKQSPRLCHLLTQGSLAVSNAEIH